MPTVEINVAGDIVPYVGISDDVLDISFFIPCYNEEPYVLGAIRKIDKVASKLGLTHEILVFDDGSQDRTVEVVKEYRAANPQTPVRLFVNDVNRGVARNFFEGAFCARGRYYRLICGDDVESIETLEGLLGHFGKADIIIPYFTVIEGRPFHRHVLSHIYTWCVNRASGFHLNYYNGCPIYRRFDVMRFHVETTGLGYQAEFLTRLLHEKRSFIELALVSIDREGSGSLNLRNSFSVAHSLLKIMLRRMRVYLFK